MTPPLTVLLNLVEDELRDFEGVRIRPVFPASLKRSPDLEQDYDPELNDLHRKAGVRVQTKRHEFFFPVDWVLTQNRTQITDLFDEIRHTLA